MWDRKAKKTLFTLNVDDYEPRITELTYPFLKRYAARIGADFHVISERKFPDWPVTYEKLQIYQLAQEQGNDWNVYIDSDTLVHPECIDFTEVLPRNTIAHNANDMAAVRWDYDRFFRRDGRNIGSCNWFAIASDWCIELWRPVEDLTVEEAVARIHPTVNESTTVVTPRHLIDDFVLSRNIAQYGLKSTTLKQLLVEVGLPQACFFWHAYTIPTSEKIDMLHKVIASWKLT